MEEEEGPGEQGGGNNRPKPRDSMITYEKVRYERGKRVEAKRKSEEDVSSILKDL